MLHEFIPYLFILTLYIRLTCFMLRPVTKHCRASERWPCIRVYID